MDLRCGALCGKAVSREGGPTNRAAGLWDRTPAHQRSGGADGERRCGERRPTNTFFLRAILLSRFFLLLDPFSPFF